MRNPDRGIEHRAWRIQLYQNPHYHIDKGEYYHDQGCYEEIIHPFDKTLQGSFRDVAIGNQGDGTELFCKNITVKPLLFFGYYIHRTSYY